MSLGPVTSYAAPPSNIPDSRYNPHYNSPLTGSVRFNVGPYRDQAVVTNGPGGLMGSMNLANNADPSGFNNARAGYDYTARSLQDLYTYYPEPSNLGKRYYANGYPYYGRFLPNRQGGVTNSLYGNDWYNGWDRNGYGVWTGNNYAKNRYWYNNPYSAYSAYNGYGYGNNGRGFYPPASPECAPHLNCASNSNPNDCRSCVSAQGGPSHCASQICGPHIA